MPEFLGADWITTLTSIAIYSVAALGFSILYGRVGMISLGQIALLTIGCWIGTRLSYGTSLPFPLLLLAAGGTHGRDRDARRTAGPAPLGDLPRPDHADVRRRHDHRPGGDRLPERRRRLHRPLGDRGAHDQHAHRCDRPSGAIADVAFYRYTVVVCAILFLFALLHVAAKPGRAWAAIRESEPAALAAGVNITLYKLWAFALASFVTGVAGCLLAAQVGVPRAITFQTQDSLTLAATALIGGIFSLWGAVVAGIFQQGVPFLFQAQWGINPNFVLILFGVGLLQVLLTAPGGLADQLPKDLAKLWGLIVSRVREQAAAEKKAP